MKKWKIYSLLFGLLSSFFISTLITSHANAIESYRVSPENERDFKRSFHSKLSIWDSNNIDIHYYFYAQNNYDENIRLVYYTCDYVNGYNDDYTIQNISKVSGCGIYLRQEGGKFKFFVKASSYGTAQYSRRTNKITGFGYVYQLNLDILNEVFYISDADFNNGFTLLGGSTLRENSWNREEGGFLLDPLGGGNNSGSSSSGNNQGGGFNFGGFVKGILDGITQFFRPMMDSVGKTANAVGSIVGDLSKALGEFFRPMIDSLNTVITWLSKLGSFIVDGIVGFFQGLVDIVSNIWDFLSNFFVKLIEELGKFIKWIFIPSDNFFSDIFSSFKRDLEYSLSPFNNFIRIEFFQNTSSYNCSFNISNSIFYIDICHVPERLLNWARIFVNFSLGLWTISRILRSIPVFLGAYYIWERWIHKGGSE